MSRVAPLRVGSTLALPGPAGRWRVMKGIIKRPGFVLWLVSHAHSGARFGLKQFAGPAVANTEAAREVMLQQRARGAATLSVGPLHNTEYGAVALMQLAAGGSLAAWADEARRAGTGPSVPQSLGYFRRMVLATRSAHRRAVVHRDLKPDNMLFSEGGRAPHHLFLGDFGLARPAGWRSWDGAGTLAYLAPEVVAGLPHSRAADVFSLGASLHELLFGMAPYEGDSEAETLAALLAGRPLLSRDLLAAWLVELGLAEGARGRLLALLCALCARAPADRPALDDVMILLATLDRPAHSR